MSKYGEMQTIMREEAHLVAALSAMGFEGKIERHLEPQTLFTYLAEDNEGQKAHIIIRRQNTGLSASNDIGFLKGADGCYKAIIGDYDQVCKFGDSWMGRLKQGYTEARQMAVAKLRGYVFQSREVTQTAKGEKVKLLFAVR